MRLKVVTLDMPNIDMNIVGASRRCAPIPSTSSSASSRSRVTSACRRHHRPRQVEPALCHAARAPDSGHFFRALDSLVPVAERAGTSLYIENMPFAFLPAIDGLLALNAYGNDDLGIIYDVANAWFIKEDLAEGLRKCARRLRLVHYSDTGHGVYRHATPSGSARCRSRSYRPCFAKISAMTGCRCSTRSSRQRPTGRLTTAWRA